MLVPVAEPVAGSSFQGSVHFVEYHGHEWLAHLDMGVPLVDIATVNARPRRDVPASGARHARAALANGDGWLPAGAELIRRLRRAGDPGQPDAGAAPQPPAGAHRRADIVVRAESPRGLVAGREISVAVDVANIYLFNTDGERIARFPR